MTTPPAMMPAFTISHPNLVALHELGASSDEVYLTMELVRGRNFVGHVREAAPPGEQVQDHERLLDALLQLCDGVQVLHNAGKLHLDLKPSNILVTERGRVVVLDFGTMQDMGECGVQPEGTFAYMAPEQARARAALRWTAPTSRERLAVAASGAAEHAARPASGAPGAEAVVIRPAADTPIGPSVTQATADGALGVAAPAAEVAALGGTQAPPAEALSVVQPVAALGVTGTADPMPGVAGPDAAPPAAVPQQAPASTAPAASSANVGVGNEASTGAPALPVRLRRWLQPTPVQQRVIDAFWARADKNFVRAERLLSEAHALDPKDAEVAYQLALTYARQGRLEQTLSWAQQARELSPLDPAPVALEGDIHALRGQRLDAERAWKQCLQVRPGDPGCIRRLEQLKSVSGR